MLEREISQNFVVVVVASAVMDVSFYLSRNPKQKNKENIHIFLLRVGINAYTFFIDHANSTRRM